MKVLRSVWRVLPLGLAILVGAAASAPSPAQAQPVEVERLISEGVQLRREGKDYRALGLFQKAYDLDQSGRTATQLGLCEAALGYFVPAEQHLSEALRATRNPWLVKNEALIRKTLLEVQASIGTVDVKGTPAGAEVVVNGKPAGTLPLAKPIRVAEGVVNVLVRAPLHKEAASRITVEGGKPSTVTVNLEKTRPPVAAAAAPAAAGEAPAGEREPSPEPPEDVPGDSRTIAWMRPAAWAVLAGAVGALGVGTYGLLRQWEHGRAFDNYTDGKTMTKPCDLILADKGGTECQRLYKQANSDESLARIGFIGGGVLAAGAVLGFILSSPSAPGNEEPESSLTLVPGDGQTTPVSASWRFSF